MTMQARPALSALQPPGGGRCTQAGPPGQCGDWPGTGSYPKCERVGGCMWMPADMDAFIESTTKFSENVA